VKFGVIVYNRAVCRLTPATLRQLADRCPNLVGFKDGIGDIELMVSIRQAMGERFAYLGGLPTAEVYAAAYKALGRAGVFVGRVQLHSEDCGAVLRGRQVRRPRHAKQASRRILPALPRDPHRRAGYAVSIVKAGAAIVGHPGGPVRPPLTDLTGEEVDQLRALIDRLGPQ